MIFRIKVLKTYPRPSKSKIVKEFLGLTGYYRQFIQNYADIVLLKRTPDLNGLLNVKMRFKP